MNFKLRGASGVALLVGLSGGFQTAVAQQTPAAPANPNQTVGTSQQAAQPSGPQAAPPAQTDQNAPAATGEKVVVTGSLIATAAEDAPKPVEVFTSEQLKQQGSPTISEFVRSLTTSFGSDGGFGQTSQDAPTGAGFANADLRGIGPNGTLVLMNGRRLASTNGGFGADLNTIPNEALEAVEVLKDGASTTYGAGAVGGVLNFRTRRDIDAPTFTFERTLYDGSDGEYNIDAQTGWVGDAGNVLVSLHYGHVDALPQTARDFGKLGYRINPGPYSLNAPNPGRFQPSSSNFLTVAGPNTVGATLNDLRGSVGTQATADCQAVGGEIITNLNQAPTSTSTNTGCALVQYWFQDLVSINDSYRFYSEVNADITDSMEFHFDVTYSKSDTKRQDIPTAAPTNRVTDAGITSTIGACAASCQFVIPVQVNTYSQPNTTTVGTATAQTTRNPFIDDFMTRTGVSAAALPATGALYAAANWRPFGYGGNPYFPSGLRESHQQRERLLASVGFNGEFTGETLLGSLLSGIKYDYSGQYNTYLDTNLAPDIIVSRLQNALLGYGGFSCGAFDLVPTIATTVRRSEFAAGAAGDLAFTNATAAAASAYNRTVGIQSNTRPGTEGCEWFNPFASGWSQSRANGAANPQYNAGAPILVAGSTARPSGYGNSYGLIDWMMQERVFETQYQSATFDATWSGELPEAIQLPGGSIGWAAGSQWRMTERRSISSSGQSTNERNFNMSLCPFPDFDVVNLPTDQRPGLNQRGCSGTGAFFSADEHAESSSQSQTIAYYAEVSLPVLDNLNFSASARREVYNGGDVTGDIWSVAGKYDITDNLFIRASYGTNFRAEEALDQTPGIVTLSVTQPTRFGSDLTVDSFEFVNGGLAPEDDKTLNLGIGYNTDIGEGRLRLGLDFFQIEINGEVTTTSSATIYNNVFGRDTSACQLDRTNAANCGAINVSTALPITVGANPVSNGSLNQYANCNARLIFLVAFNTTCVQGTTTAASLAAVRTDVINGPSRVLNGLDYSVDFSYPLFDGTFGANFTATQNLVFKTQGYKVNGVVFEDPQDRLGYVNNTLTVPLVSELRANATLRWANDQHSFNLRANYQQGVQDERAGAYDPAILAAYPNGGTPTDVDGRTGATQVEYSRYGLTPKDYLDFDFNYIWTAPFWEELELRASVLNITDRNPLATQGRNGYLTGIGNPRGRQIELAVTKRF